MYAQRLLSTTWATSTLCSRCWLRQKQQLRLLQRSRYTTQLLQQRRGLSDGFGKAATAAAATQTATPLDELPAHVYTQTLGAAHDDKTLREIFDNADVWKSFSSRLHSSTAPRSGLFQNKDLTSASGFAHYTARTLAKAQSLVASIVNASTPDELGRVVRELDLLSDLLCRVIDMSDFVRSTHPDRQIVAAASEAYAAMYEYMNVLNTTTGLYEALKRALGDAHVVRRLTDEERTVAQILYKDFEKSGINLPSSARARFVQLSSEIATLGPQFVNGMRPKTTHLRFDSSRLRGMDPLIVRQLTRFGRVTLPTLGMPASHALRTVEDEDVRRELHIATHTSAPEQIETLETLLRRRAELAGLAGCESYAEVALADKMAGTPAAVLQFLSAISAANRPAAQAELDSLAAIKRELHGPDAGGLQPWDRDFYSEKLLLRARSRSKTQDELSSYFSLGIVMQGLSRLFSRLYGIRLVPVEPAPGETWNADVRRLDVISDTHGHIAVVYCDLFSRPGKNPNPAHFTVRCSRAISASEGPIDLATDGMAHTITADGTVHQLPTIALICDFATTTTTTTTSSTDSSSSSNNRTAAAGTTPTLLTFRELQTLFHEMGHALHSLLGRTNLHNVSGTRCATDWAELPSVLMEHFARDPTVLALFARHWQTDAPLPPQLLASRLARDTLLDASETRSQIVLALLDQHYHSSQALLDSSSSISSSSSNNNNNNTNNNNSNNNNHHPGFDTTLLYARTVDAESLLPCVPGTSWQGFFGHLFGYGATYYAYLFDRAIAARVWRDVFAGGEGGGGGGGGGPVERERGERYAREVLAWGGARSGWRCLAGVLGRPEMEEGGEKAMGEVGKWGAGLK